MASEKDFELLDDYITNRLNGAEKEAFEKQLKNDAELKSEHQLQQSLVEGIKSARIVELKSMLSNTVVPPVQTAQAILTKVAASLVVAGIIGTGIYFYFNHEQEKEEAPEEQPASEKKEIVQDEKTTQAESPVIEEKTLPLSSTPTEKSTKETERKSTISKPVASVKVKKDTQATTQRTKPVVFDPTAETESSSSTPIKTENAVTLETGASESKAPSIDVELDNSSKKYTFHYQFKNEKLFLYGSFEKNLYEILEFFSGNKRTMFLLYKDNYYLLNEENDKVKPLAPITDPALLKKLKEYSEN